MLQYAILLLMLILPVLWLRVVKKKSWNKTQAELLPKLNKNKWVEIIGSIKLFACLLAAFIVLYAIISFIGINDLGAVGDSVKSTPNIALLIIIMVFGVFVEEFFYRAFLQKRLGAVITTAIFAGSHVGYGSIAEIIGVFVLGLILAYWFNKNKSLFQNYFGHLLYNALALVFYLAF